MGAAEDSVSAGEGGESARLREIEGANLAADGVGEGGGGLEGKEEVGGFGAGKVEEVGRAREGGEVAVEISAGREEGLETEVEGPLVGDALVEEVSHGADVGEGADLREGIRVPEVD